MKIYKWKYIDLNNQDNCLFLHTKGTFELQLNGQEKSGVFLENDDILVLQPTYITMAYVSMEPVITFQKENGCIYGNYSIWIPRECWGSECANPSESIEVGIIDCSDVDSSKDGDPFTITGN